MRLIILFAITFVITFCYEKNFICYDGASIDIELICDGIRHCSDGSDESFKLCLNIMCRPDQIRCHSGACVDRKYLCDGTPNCFDGSDEETCNNTISCNKNNFRCDNNKCLGVKKLCDYTLDCSDGIDEDPALCREHSCPADAYRCKIGGCISQSLLCNGRSDCIDGSDESSLLCKCLNGSCNYVTCPPVTSPNILAVCHHAHLGIISCFKPVPPRTVVEYRCKPEYHPTADHITNNYTICQLDGTWNKEILKCTINCGRFGSEANPLIVHGFNVYSKQIPWHAVLYTFEYGKWEFACGGTLITELLVITAAHCTWTVKPHELQVALGKSKTDYREQEENSQMRNVVKIFKHPLYQDAIGNYGSDIAILVLNRKVVFNSFAKPACIDWKWTEERFRSDTNHPGLIAGMGFTEYNKPSSTLKATYLKVVDAKHCIKSQNEDFKKYIIFGTFCAGWENGTSVCNGDSGGGLVFRESYIENRWTLQGIVSLSPRLHGEAQCDPMYFTIIVKVGVYVPWIQAVVDHIEKGVPYSFE